MMSHSELYELEKKTEVWTQDASDPDWWHAPNGVIVNGAALAEREAYYRVVRRHPAQPETESATEFTEPSAVRSA